MDSPATLVSDLAALVEPSDEPAQSFHDQLQRLMTALQSGISSYLGFSLTTEGGAHPVRLQSFVSERGNLVALTSLQFPLAGAHRGLRTSVIFFAGVPGALVDLAADLDYALGSGGPMVLDRHLDGLVFESGVTGLVEAAAINRALGFLLEQGYPLADGLVELQRRATSAGLAVPEVAADLLGRPSGADPG